LRGIRGYATFVFSPEIRREECHALGRPLHRPYPMLKEPARRGCCPTPASGRNLPFGGDPRRDHPGRGGIRRGEAAGRGIRSLSFHAPSRTCGPARATRRRGGSPCAASRARSHSHRSSAPPESFSTAGIPTGSSTSSRISGSPRPGARSENSRKRRRRREPTSSWRTSSTRSPTTCSDCGTRWALPASTSASIRGTRHSSPACRSRSGQRRSARGSVCCTCTTTGEGGTITFRWARGDQLPGGPAGGAGRGASPILTVEPHRKEHFARSVAGLHAILATI